MSRCDPVQKTSRYTKSAGAVEQGVVEVLFIDSSSGWFSIKSKWLPGERVLAAMLPPAG